MQQLHLVGFTTDHQGLILGARRGTTEGGYVVTLDQAFVEHIEELLRLQASETRPDHLPAVAGNGTSNMLRRPKAQSRLTPREVQALLRTGRSVSEIAEVAGMSEDWIGRFAPPVLAEQARVVERALALTYSKPRIGPSIQPLGDSVVWNLAERGTILAGPAAEDAWSAFQQPDGGWVVRVSYLAERRRQHADWSVDMAQGALKAINRLGNELGYVEPGRRRPQVLPPSTPVSASAQRAAVAPPKPATPPALPARPSGRLSLLDSSPATRRATPRATMPAYTTVPRSDRRAPDAQTLDRPTRAPAAPSIDRPTRAPAAPSIDRPTRAPAAQTIERPPAAGPPPPATTPEKVPSSAGGAALTRSLRDRRPRPLRAPSADQDPQATSAAPGREARAPVPPPPKAAGIGNDAGDPTAAGEVRGRRRRADPDLTADLRAASAGRPASTELPLRSRRERPLRAPSRIVRDSLRQPPVLPATSPRRRVSPDDPVESARPKVAPSTADAGRPGGSATGHRRAPDVPERSTSGTYRFGPAHGPEERKASTAERFGVGAGGGAGAGASAVESRATAGPAPASTPDRFAADSVPRRRSGQPMPERLGAPGRPVTPARPARPRADRPLRAPLRAPRQAGDVDREGRHRSTASARLGDDQAPSADDGPITAPGPAVEVLADSYVDSFDQGHAKPGDGRDGVMIRAGQAGRADQPASRPSAEAPPAQDDRPPRSGRLKLRRRPQGPS